MSDVRAQRKLGAALATVILGAIFIGLAFAHWHGYQNNRCNTHDPIVICQWWEAA